MGSHFISIDQPINFFWRSHHGEPEWQAANVWSTEVKMPYIPWTSRRLAANSSPWTKFVPTWNYEDQDPWARIATYGKGVGIHRRVRDTDREKAWPKRLAKGINDVITLSILGSNSKLTSKRPKQKTRSEARIFWAGPILRRRRSIFGQYQDRNRRLRYKTWHENGLEWIFS